MPPPARAMIEASNAGDFASVRASMADACVIEDHRRLRVAEMDDADAYVALLRSTREIAPDYLLEVLRCDRIEPWGQVPLTRGSGTTAEGGQFESYTLAVVAWDEDGRTSLIALYDPEDADEAMARFEQARPR